MSKRMFQLITLVLITVLALVGCSENSSSGVFGK